MKNFGELIYTPETASGEAISKIESHTPKIEAPDTVKPDEPFTVKIFVGPHPNTVEHSMRRIEVYLYEEGRKFNPILVATIDLTPVYSVPKIELTLKIKRNSVIYALGYCNLHGIWESRKEVKVSE